MPRPQNTPPRLLVVGLDGYEQSIADRLISSGELPNLARIHDSSARFLLDHGAAKRTGLAWEHVSSGLSPADAHRWSVIHFDKETYAVKQEGVRFPPFARSIDGEVVIFDAPYFDMRAAPNVRGMTAWGAHDPGTDLTANPSSLVDEIRSRFGDYPATEWIYGFAWPSADRCRIMGSALSEAVRLRTKISRWLLAERFPDWDLAMVVVSEPHSALEALWHGIDEHHALYGHESAEAARDGLIEVYRATDELLGSLSAHFPDATLLLFSMHGMGPNESDVPSMALLPELLHRHFLGESFLQLPKHWTGSDDIVHLPPESTFWDVRTEKPRGLLERVFGRLGMRDSVDETPANAVDTGSEIDWMPAARFRSQWPRMPAFALPSYYDGSIRVNLVGRERHGIVRLTEYEEFCDGIEQLLRGCIDPMTGQSIVKAIDRMSIDNPLELDPSAGDMTVLWNGPVLALEHPMLGRIGPLPFRRTGGHTGPYGVAMLSGKDIEAGDRGLRSAFDVVPTIFDLMRQEASASISGSSLMRGSQEERGRSAPPL